LSAKLVTTYEDKKSIILGVIIITFIYTNNK
jgi:hypothetical protein